MIYTVKLNHNLTSLNLQLVDFQLISDQVFVILVYLFFPKNNDC